MTWYRMSKNYIDHQLLSDIRAITTGSNVHKINNLVTAYEAAARFLSMGKSVEQMTDMLNRKEAGLREILGKHNKEQREKKII